MRKSIFLYLCFFNVAFALAQGGNASYESAFIRFRTQLDEEYKNPESSPLEKEAALDFGGHSFFPFDTNYIVTAFAERLAEPELFKMLTTGDKRPEYERLYKLTFSIRDTICVLYAYRNVALSKKEEYKNHLFLPFTDKSNGFETYGGGRYIDLQVPEGELMLLDFNQSYHPYCAYSKKYSCPIPPRENALPLKIAAGIMAPAEHP